MKTVFTFLLSESVLIPIIAGLLIFKKLKLCWLPFFVLLVLAFLTELISFYFIENLKISNASVIKIYSLCECILIIYQLFLLQNKRAPNFHFILIAACVVFWFIENIALQGLSEFSPYFRVFYAFIIVLLSINLINSLIFDQKNALFKNPVFVLCLAFIIFFIYQIIYEASFYIGSDKYVVANKIIVLFAYINATTNLMYAFTIALIFKYNFIACRSKANIF